MIASYRIFSGLSLALTVQTAAQFGPLEGGRAEVFAEGEQPKREVVFALEQIGNLLIAADVVSGRSAQKRDGA